MKALMVAGVIVADIMLMMNLRLVDEIGVLTRSAVQVGEVQDVSRAADGVAG